MAARWITFNPDAGSSTYSRLYLHTNEYGTVYFSTTTTGDFASRIKRNDVTVHGYKFSGWAYPDSSGNPVFIAYSSGEFINSTDLKSVLYSKTVTTVYAYLTDWPARTLNFNANGGTVSPSSKTVHKDSALGTLPTPTRPEFVFDGWYKDIEPVEGESQVTSTTEYWQDENGTIYARWRDTHHTLTLDAGIGGAVSPSTIAVQEQVAIGTLPTPTRSGYHFSGWYTSAEGGSLVTSDTVYTATTDTTIFARWTKNPVLTFDANGGTVSPMSKECWYGDPIGTLPIPAYTGYFFDGWYTDAEGGESVNVQTVYNWSGDATIYAHWTLNEQYRITFDANGGTASETERVIRPGDVVGELPTATLQKHVFDGWFDARTGGTQWTSETVFDLHEDITLYAHWTRTEYEISFNAMGGTASFDTKDVTINEPVGELPTCEKYANAFLGWFDAQTGGTEWDEDTVYELTSDTTLYAHWQVDPSYSRTLVLDADGGTPVTQTVQCTYGLTVGALPYATKTGKKFGGWFYGTTAITSETVCDWSGTRTAKARWVDNFFGDVTDYFNLGSAALVPIHSDSGDNKQRICVSHTGRYEQNVDAVSGVWRNPSVTYMVVAQMTLTVTLGKAFAAQYIGTGSSRKMTVSGYMITNVNVDTKMAYAPTVTISSVSNEGADAVNATLPTAASTPFKFSVSISPRHRPQNLMGAIIGGGELQSCSLEAKCDPVVVVENQMPCASDVVHGKITVTAATGAYEGEGEPTAANGFTATAAPVAHDNIGWKSYSFTAEKTM